MPALTTNRTRLRWHPDRKEWQFSLGQLDGTDGAWAPLNAEWHWHEDERRQAAADARDAFGRPTQTVRYEETAAEPENFC